jgi:hypothetical protein
MFGFVCVPSNAFVVCPAEKGQLLPRHFASDIHSFHRIPSHPVPHIQSQFCIRHSKVGTQVRVQLHSSGTKDVPGYEASYAELPNVVLEAVAKAAAAAVEKSTGEGTESGGPGLLPHSLPRRIVLRDTPTIAPIASLLVTPVTDPHLLGYVRQRRCCDGRAVRVGHVDR